MKSILLRDIAFEQWKKRTGYDESRMRWFAIWRDIGWSDMFGERVW